MARDRPFLFRCLLVVVTLFLLFLISAKVVNLDKDDRSKYPHARRHPMPNVTLAQSPLQLTPAITKLLTSKLPRVDSQGYWTGSPILVSKSPVKGRDLYPHTFPYAGEVMHLGTSIHPSKDRLSDKYVLTSLWYFEAPDSYKRGQVQSTLSDFWWDMSFECVYDGGEVVQGIPDQQSRAEYLLVECPLPAWANKIVTKSGSTRARYDAFRKIRESTLSLSVWIPLDREVFGDLINDIPHGAVTRSEQSKTTDVLGAVQPAVLSQQASVTPPRLPEYLLVRHPITEWETPRRHAALSICTAPLRFDGQMTMTDVIEWRVWHMYQGVDVVHFYSRTPIFRQWVDRMNSILGVEDTYKDVPIYTPNAPHHLTYADQPQWQADCLLRYGHADDWQAHIDIDEYLIPTDEPFRDATVQRLERLPEDVGSIKFRQVYYGTDRHEAPKVSGFDMFPRNGYVAWEPNAARNARWPKAVHRTAAVEQLWVHDATGLGVGWKRHLDEVGSNTPGVLQLIHSRRQAYKGVEFPDKFEATTGWKRQWSDLAEILQRCGDLHTLVPFKA